MNDKRNFIWLREDLEWLRPVFAEWQKKIERHIALQTPEGIPSVPYAGNERANVSLLAGAIWCCDGQALEEFNTIRKPGQTASGGRVDLWFHHCGRSCLVEAKQLFQTNNDRVPIDESVAMQKTIAALAQIKTIDAAHSAKIHAFGMTFITPKTFVGEQAHDRTARAEKLATEWHSWATDNPQNTGFDFVATCFPPFDPDKMIFTETTKTRKYVWPGVYLVGKRFRAQPLKAEAR